MSYRTLNHIVPVQLPCDKGLFIMCNRAVETIYWSLGNELEYHGQYCTGTSTIWYRAVYHELLSPGPYYIGPSTIRYRVVYKVLPDRGNFLLSRGSSDTVPWIILYGYINKMVRGCVPCAIGPWRRSTGRWTMS